MVAVPRHGGDLAFAHARYPDVTGSWLDLSTGINPVPYPAARLPVENGRLPGSDDLADLLVAARTAYGIPDGVPCIAAPGSEMAIQLLPLTVPPARVAIVAPTYASHRRAWEAHGHRVVEIAAVGQAPADAGIVILANPNNPDGRVVSPADLARMAERLAAAGGLLLVDEAFADVAPEVSLSPYLGEAPAVVLRSLGKFYGLPGLRLGFVAGRHEAVGRLQRLLGDWPVSAPAIAAASVALPDAAWRRKARARLKRSTAALHRLLGEAGLSVAGGTDLFTLVEDPRAHALHEGLAREGIWTRVFQDRPRWLRLGLTADTPAFRRFAEALRRVTATATTG
ncbi:MAG TPA: threonine-phosphate decarboxylase CobD [Bauldia sp.]|nr:threonine-phosphate decarboxylase CobD [Bauldia sp.]